MKLSPDTGPQQDAQILNRKRGLHNKWSDYSFFETIWNQSLTERTIYQLVIDGRRMSMHSLIRNVGNGSNRHDLVGDLLIILSDLSKDC